MSLRIQLSNLFRPTHNCIGLANSSFKSFKLQPSQLIGLPFSTGAVPLVKRGEIYMIAPKTHLEGGAVADSKGGSRPGVVVSTDWAIQKTGFVMLARLSGSQPRYKFEVPIPKGPITGLDRDSKLMTNQIFTVAQASLSHTKRLGVVPPSLMQRVTQELKTAFSPFIKLPNMSPEFARGDIIKIPQEQMLGVVVSNDLGNQMSEVIMLSHSSIDSRVENEFEVKVKARWTTEDSNQRGDLVVCCNEVDTVDQQRIVKIGQLLPEDLETINKVLFKAFGIEGW